jgi:hypothetical protein
MSTFNYYLRKVMTSENNWSQRIEYMGSTGKRMRYLPLWISIDTGLTAI